MTRPASLIATAGLTALGVWAAALLDRPVQAAPDNYTVVQRGRYLATVGDCNVCHTAPGGQPYAGGRDLATPFGTVMTANLTPDGATGIGRWTPDDFYRAMHEGKRPDGTRLYPGLPVPVLHQGHPRRQRCDLRLLAAGPRPSRTPSTATRCRSRSTSGR